MCRSVIIAVMCSMVWAMESRGIDLRWSGGQRELQVNAAALCTLLVTANGPGERSSGQVVVSACQTNGA
jgi:hypothetical protein